MWINNQLIVKGSALILSILQKHFVNLQFNRLFHILAKNDCWFSNLSVESILILKPTN